MAWTNGTGCYRYLAMMLVVPVSFVCYPAYAQQATGGPGLPDSNNIYIFHDDFSSDTVGKFPHHWFSFPALMDQDFYHRNEPPGAMTVSVQNMDDSHILRVNSHGSNMPLAPDLGVPQYLTDTFNVTFSALIENENCDIAIVFYDKDGHYIFYSRLYGDHKIEALFAPDPDPNDSLNSNYSDKIKINEWHHYRFEYKNPILRVYIDEQQVATFGDFPTGPASLAIAGNTLAMKITPISFGDFTIIKGDISAAYSDLATGKKLITHAIHFETGKSNILPSTYGFLQGMARWMNDNPDVKLEIDGHTDIVGSAAFNSKLSLDRAKAVKNKLVAYGVDPHRLTTHGYGATQPIAPNQKPEGMLANRRVEFVKMK